MPWWRALRRICGAGLAWGLAVTLSAAELKLNDIQVLGSHNSYKLTMAPDKFAELSARRPELARSLEYWHLPLREQLELGLRKLELDVFFDPAGTLYPIPDGQLDGGAPGRTGVSPGQFRVQHVQNLDNRSSCATLVACLVILRDWSQEHPQHVPIFISFNAKDSAIEMPGYVGPLPFAEDAWQAMDAELRAVLGDRLITPADVFAGEAREWPSLDAVRGRFVLILDEAGQKRRDYAVRWRERAMFANLPEEHVGAAILVINDPVAEFERIRALVRAGFIVRTRADADTIEARSGDYTRSAHALASGAQLVSTDYYLPASHFGTSYRVELPNGPRCNPVRKPSFCELPNLVRQP